MGAKLPALQFYPSDWRNDLGVQSLSRHDRMVWFDLLMLMHESERRGVLVLAGKPMSDEMIAELIHLDNQTFKQIKELLLTRGVASLEEETCALMNRRMVRDEELRKIRKNAGEKGGNPALVNQKHNQTPKQNTTPSYSSSVSIATSVKGNSADAPPLEPFSLDSDPMNEIPDGLAVHNYADAIMEAMGWPKRSMYSVHVGLVDALPILAREEGCSLGEACRRMYARIREAEATTKGIKWRFWIGEEQGWKLGELQALSTEGME